MKNVELAPKIYYYYYRDNCRLFIMKKKEIKISISTFLLYTERHWQIIFSLNTSLHKISVFGVSYIYKNDPFLKKVLCGMCDFIGCLKRVKA